MYAACTLAVRDEGAFDVDCGDGRSHDRVGGAGCGDAVQRVDDARFGSCDDSGHPGGDTVGGQQMGQFDQLRRGDRGAVDIQAAVAVDLEVDQAGCHDGQAGGFGLDPADSVDDAASGPRDLDGDVAFVRQKAPDEFGVCALSHRGSASASR